MDLEIPRTQKAQVPGIISYVKVFGDTFWERGCPWAFSHKERRC